LEAVNAVASNPLTALSTKCPCPSLSEPSGAQSEHQRADNGQNRYHAITPVLWNLTDTASTTAGLPSTLTVWPPGADDRESPYRLASESHGIVIMCVE